MLASGALLFVLCVQFTSSTDYEPNWKSLDSRPNPLWYDEVKFGIFMHWGLYSVPSFHSEWMWYSWKGSKDNDTVQFMKDNYKPGFTYADFGPMFTAEFFNATLIAQMIKNSGARYYVLTSKHHEGYTMWPSYYSWNWNSVDLGPKRDLVGELRTAVLNQTGVHFGLYFSQYEWFNPLYLMDKNNKFKTQEYVATTSLPQMHEIVENYKPEIIWSDGDWEAPDTYWNSTQFIAWLFNESPVNATVLVNDRWGDGIAGHHGSYFTFADRFDPGHLIPHKWENCLTMDKVSWGYRRRMTFGDVLSINELITKLARTISCNGNLLLNVGPTHTGLIVPIFEERLLQMGEWLEINGEAVYETKPWIHQNDSLATNVWFTSTLRNSTGYSPYRVFNPQITNNTIVYAILLEWPKDAILQLQSTKALPQTKVSMLGYRSTVMAKPYKGGLRIDLSSVEFEDLPSHDAWVLKLEYLATVTRDPVWELCKEGKNKEYCHDRFQNNREPKKDFNLKYVF